MSNERVGDAKVAVLESAGGTVTIVGDKHATQQLFLDLAREKILDDQRRMPRRRRIRSRFVTSG